MNLWERQDGQPSLHIQALTLTDNSAVLLAMVKRGVGIARLLDIVAAPSHLRVIFENLSVALSLLEFDHANF